MLKRFFPETEKYGKVMLLFFLSETERNGKNSETERIFLTKHFYRGKNITKQNSMFQLFSPTL
jgi:hypothetical protein